jgi:O-acetyl-ADP-ribose deacetylase (regulator of RNase III)
VAVSYAVADALASDIRTLAHGCNAKGKYGRGFAQVVRGRYPLAYAAYMERHSLHGLKPGDIVAWKGPDRTVLNCITQDRYGKDGALYVDYDAVRTCMRVIERCAKAHLQRREGIFFDQPLLAMPRIGSGYGGGDWSRIAAIIAEEISSIDVVVHDWPPPAALAAC